MNEDLLLKFFRFGVVGFTGVLIDFSVTWLCKEILKINKYIANSLGFIAAATSNYFLNRRWTFHNHDPEILMQYTKFLIVAAIGLLISNTIIYFLCEKRKWNFYFSKLIAIVIVMLWNFLVNYRFTFQ